jgi:hypothetical protein
MGRWLVVLDWLPHHIEQLEPCLERLAYADRVVGQRGFQRHTLEVSHWRHPPQGFNAYELRVDDLVADDDLNFQRLPVAYRPGAFDELDEILAKLLGIGLRWSLDRQRLYRECLRTASHDNDPIGTTAYLVSAKVGYQRAVDQIENFQAVRHLASVVGQNG